MHPGQSGSGFGTATSTWTPAGLDPPRRGGYGGAGSGFGGYGGAPTGTPAGFDPPRRGGYGGGTPTGTPAGFDPPRRGGYGGGLSARGGYVGGHYAQGVKTEPGGETNHQYSETPDPRVFQGIRPKAFSGSKDREEARRFVRRFEHYCSTIKANPAAWGAMFPMYLEGHASDWAMTAPMTELQCDWGRLREEFLRRFGPSVLEASNEYIQAWLGDKLHQGDAYDAGKVREYGFRWREKADLVQSNCPFEVVLAFIFERSLPPWMHEKMAAMKGEKLTDQPSVATLADWAEKLAATTKPGKESPQQAARANCVADVAASPRELQAHLHYTHGACPWLTEAEFNERKTTRRCYGCGSAAHLFPACQSPNGKALQKIARRDTPAAQQRGRKPFKRVARAQQVEAGVTGDDTVPEQGRLPEVDETEESLSEDSGSFSGNE